MKTALQELHDHLVSAWSSPGDLWRPDLIIEKVEQMITVEKEQKESQTGMEGNEIEKAAEEYANKQFPNGAYRSDEKGYYWGRCYQYYSDGLEAGANWQKEIGDKEVEYWAGKAHENMQAVRKVQTDLGAELTRTNAQLDEMVTKYNELSKKYADLYTKHYGK